MFSLPIVETKKYLESESKNLSSPDKKLQAMEKVGLLFFEKILEIFQKSTDQKKIVLLLGKGNNAADALVVGRHALLMGIKVIGYEIFNSEKSQLYHEQKEKFLSLRGEILPISSLENEKDLFVVDGVFGSGFKGIIDESCKQIFSKIRNQAKTIIAIDSPSGVSGDEGATNGSLVADYTIAIDFPRLGFFLNDTPNHLGILDIIYPDCVSIDQIKEHIKGYFIQRQDIKMPLILKKRHKYQAGLVAAFCGSSFMPGTINFTGLSALKSGAGIIKFFHPQKLPKLADELMVLPTRHASKVLKKAQVFLAGCGLGRSLRMKLWFNYFFNLASCPKVIDADGLYLLKWKKIKKSLDPILITPHKKECLDFFELPKNITDEKLFEILQSKAEESNCTILLKGLPTIIFSKGTLPIIIYGGDPGMATAGSGDVLSGMISGMIAQKLPFLQAVITACFLHQKAGELAANQKTSYGMIATDIMEKIPDAIFSILPKGANKHTLSDTNR